jgi:hypothetical protein
MLKNRQAINLHLNGENDVVLRQTGLYAPHLLLSDIACAENDSITAIADSTM